MTRLMDVVVLSGFLLLLLTAVLQGYLKPFSAALAFAVAFAILVISRILGSNLIQNTLRIGFAALALWLFAVTAGGGNWRGLTALLAPVLVLLVVLYGVYTMVLGPFMNKKRQGKRH